MECQVSVSEKNPAKRERERERKKARKYIYAKSKTGLYFLPANNRERIVFVKEFNPPQLNCTRVRSAILSIGQSSAECAASFSSQIALV